MFLACANDACYLRLTQGCRVRHLNATDIHLRLLRTGPGFDLLDSCPRTLGSVNPRKVGEPVSDNTDWTLKWFSTARLYLLGSVYTVKIFVRISQITSSNKSIAGRRRQKLLQVHLTSQSAKTKLCWIVSRIRPREQERRRKNSNFSTCSKCMSKAHL